MLNSSLITSDESMVVSPHTTINKSMQSKRRDRKLGISQCITPTWNKVNENSSIMTSDRSKRTDITSSDIPSESSEWSIEDQYQTTPGRRTTARQTSTPERPPGPLLEERFGNILNSTNIAEEEEEPSWSEASEQRLLESEKQGMMHKKYKPHHGVKHPRGDYENHNYKEKVIDATSKINRVLLSGHLAPYLRKRRHPKARKQEMALYLRTLALLIANGPRSW